MQFPTFLQTWIQPCRNQLRRSGQQHCWVCWLNGFVLLLLWVLWLKPNDCLDRVDSATEVLAREFKQIVDLSMVSRVRDWYFEFGFSFRYYLELRKGPFACGFRDLSAWSQQRIDSPSRRRSHVADKVFKRGLGLGPNQDTGRGLAVYQDQGRQSYGHSENGRRIVRRDFEKELILVLFWNEALAVIKTEIYSLLDWLKYHDATNFIEQT